MFYLIIIYIYCRIIATDDLLCCHTKKPRAKPGFFAIYAEPWQMVVPGGILCEIIRDQLFHDLSPEVRIGISTDKAADDLSITQNLLHLFAFGQFVHQLIKVPYLTS